MLTGFEPTPKGTVGEHLTIITNRLIKELCLERSIERSSCSDITWLVRFSSDRLVHLILLLNIYLVIFYGQPGILYSLSL